MAKTPLCFVIMGFGKKPDYSKRPRTLDLDRTYHGIIRPAAKECGMTCLRADEVTHSGVIDQKMYELLLSADVVIADISTANPNALYELGVRHALRPFSTIIMKERDGTFHFDLRQVATLEYKHLGEDIGVREALEKKDELVALIRAVLAAEVADSPVYTFLHGLTRPTLAGLAIAGATPSALDDASSLPYALQAGRAAAAASRSGEARDAFQRAYDLESAARVPGGPPVPAQVDPYIVQQLALHTYKAGSKDPAKPVRVQALNAAWAALEPLAPFTSIDPETVGIAGAIQKRLYVESDDLVCLNRATDLYGRGFVLSNDYYNGENYALCLDWRARRESDPDEANYDRRTAKNARARIIEGLRAALEALDSKERSDYRWMLATMANTLVALGKDGSEFETRFMALKPAGWEVDTFTNGKRYASEIAAG